MSMLHPMRDRVDSRVGQLRQVSGAAREATSIALDQRWMPLLGERYPIKALLIHLDNREQERRVFNAVDRVRLASGKE